MHMSMAIGGGLFLLGLILFIKGTRSSSKYAILLFHLNMERTPILNVKDLAGQSVELYGWVATRRDHGKIIFIDLRDRSGISQLVFTPENKEIYQLADKLRSEWV